MQKKKQNKTGYQRTQRKAKCHLCQTRKYGRAVNSFLKPKGKGISWAEMDRKLMKTIVLMSRPNLRAPLQP